MSVSKNLELKVRIESIRKAVSTARKLGACDMGEMRQVDIYYRVASGRMKLREIDGKKAELIFYDRPNSRGAKYSRYSVLPVPDPRALDVLLAQMFGREAVVKKIRRLLLIENARIHIDRVEDLGDFLEFEVVVEQGKRQARELFDRLRDAFAIDKDHTEAGSYREIILKRFRRR